MTVEAAGARQDSGLEAGFLFAYHDVKYHVVGVLHAYRADPAEISDGLFDVFFDYAVVLGDADALTGQDCGLKCA